MYKRRFKWFGRLEAEDGSSIWHAQRTIVYSDARGVFEFPLEDGFLYPKPYQTNGQPIQLSESEVNVIIERLLGAVRSEGGKVEIFRGSDSPSEQ